MTEPAVAVVFVLKVPEAFVAMSQQQIKHVLQDPENLERLLDEISKTIKQYLGKPVDYRALLTNLAAELPLDDQN